VIEEQIELEVLSSDFQRDLAPNEGEAEAQFDEKGPQVSEEPLFQVVLVSFRCEGQKIEVVRILEELLCQVGLRRRKGGLKVRHGLPLAAVEAALDVDHERVPAPAVLNRLAGIPKTLFRRLHFLQKGQVVVPG
jgi:hypothetical protein